MKDNFSIKGEVKLVLLDQDGNEKLKREFNNLVVTAGKNWVISRMNSASASVMTHIAVGTGSTAPTITDTTLGTEVYRGTVDTSGGVPSGNTLTFSTTLAAGEATYTLSEVGIFNAASGGSMLARATFTAIPKGASDILNISWVFTLN